MAAEERMESAFSVTERFAAHVAGTRYADLPADAVARAKTFILDTIGVGIAGSSTIGSGQLDAAAARWGAGPEALVWGRAERMPAPTAAFLNGYAVHCQEYDCVHEAAVLHPLATLLPAALAFADREGRITGRALIEAVAVGVDVSAGLGIAARTGLRFFRPATAGGLGAAAAVARLAGFDEARIVAALGLQYAQTSGSMQPHTEGSMALPMQVGFNSRAALCAVDLAGAGATGPRAVIEGPYGYLPTFEGEFDIGPTLDGLGRIWRVGELSHKPFPAGRVAHAGIEGLMGLIERHGFSAADVERVILKGPSLVHRLAARPDIPEPASNYAQLCTGFIVATVLRHGHIDLAHYRGEHLTDPETHALARQVVVEIDDNPDPNALVPQRLEVKLTDGRVLDWTCEAMLASNERRLTREQHLAKFRRCLDFAAAPLAADAGERLVALVDGLEDVIDVRALTDALTPRI